ncbi:MAG: 2-phospho-L-lactate guanylyltransferase [Candidatus Nanopelagicales bacterium]
MSAAPLTEWTVVVPVKALDRGKSRLSTRTAAGRRSLSLAFALDTVAAAVAAGPSVLVVAGDDVREAVAALGARWHSDPGGGINAAVEHAAATLPDRPLAVLVGDLPALRPEELRAALDEARRVPRGLVADAAGVGSTLLTALSGQALRPAFGPRSRAAHRASGAVELALAPVPGLRRDVDTEVDLWDARRLGVGPATAAALAEDPA